MKDELREIILATVNKSFPDKDIRQELIPDFSVDVPSNPEHGHYATNIAFKLAPVLKAPPRKIAEAILKNLSDPHDVVERVDVAGPGFINFFIKRDAWLELISRILKEKDDYGRGKEKAKGKILVEYVSANPTGPLHLGHGRGAVVGDTLCRVMSFRGFDVFREFYINDAGKQVRLLGESIYSRLRQKNESNFPFPEDGYHGEYIVELGEAISRERELLNLPQEDAIEICMDEGMKIMLQEIRDDLEAFGCVFDNWFSERSIYTSGEFDKSMEELKSNGRVYEKEGALWIKTSDYGDDKDRVIRKKNGDYTYFASDIAYHINKWNRGFAKAVNIWGADHHGYINRVKAVLRARGIPQDWLNILLVQLVKLWENGKEVRMSKRTGQYVTLRELMDEVGKDAVRFVFLTKSHDSPLDFDINLVKKKDPENVVYYVQYAHARACSILRKAEEQGISLSDKGSRSLKFITLDEEMKIIRKLAEFPDILDEICRSFEPHRLTYYLQELASLFHRYFNLGNTYPDKRVITDNIELTSSRVSLVEAVRIVLNKGLHLMGVSAPERM